MDTQNAITPISDFSAAITLVQDTLTSDHSKRAYGQAIADFMLYWERQGRPELSKAVIQKYLAGLTGSAATKNLRRSAIRKLVSELVSAKLLDRETATTILEIKGVKSSGVRTGNWLTWREAQDLINSPDISTVKGLRDRAILAVQVGAGLRRSEVAGLTFDHIQQREGRWVIVDLIGKGNRVRTVPIPSWLKVAIDTWQTAAKIDSGKVFRQMDKGDHVTNQGITSQVVYRVVLQYAGDNIAAHDLRRTFAKLAHKGGAAIDQIQLTLGHASIKTTERYLGVQQNLTDAPCDKLGLNLSGD